jgi:excisionase family DNA binding protein
MIASTIVKTRRERVSLSLDRQLLDDLRATQPEGVDFSPYLEDYLRAGVRALRPDLSDYAEYRRQRIAEAGA